MKPPLDDYQSEGFITFTRNEVQKPCVHVEQFYL